MASANSHIIEVEDLHKSYGALKAVDGVSFSVRTGEVFGILGPNGAGKTTTVEVLEGMRAPDSGRAVINGIDVSEDPRGSLWDHTAQDDFPTLGIGVGVHRRADLGAAGLRDRVR